MERIFSKTKPEERTWAKLVNLNTVHWYCDGPEPTPAAIKYESVAIHSFIIHYYYHFLTPFRRQAMLMTKGLMDRALHQEMALERVSEKARLTDEELLELKSWKVVTEQKLKLAEQMRDEYQRMTEELKTVLEDKENELRLAKEKAVQEYRDFDALLTELGTSYNDGFDDALRQAKALYPKLDFSAVNINVAEAMSVQPDASDDTAELFAEERPVTVVTKLHAEEGKTHEARDPVVPDV